MIEEKLKPGVFRKLPAAVAAAAGLTLACLVFLSIRAIKTDRKQAWNPRAAAEYLDRREVWWSQWPVSQRDHGSYCISCHTALPYALARPALRALSQQRNPAEPEVRLLKDVEDRTRRWNSEQPYYSDAFGRDKLLQARGTEAVVNALVLASANAGGANLSDNAVAAFGSMWTSQIRSGPARGAWAWLDFGNEPFEAATSTYYGAALAAVAVSLAPPAYRQTLGVQDNLLLLQEYLRREGPRQPLAQRAVTLWASSRWPELLSMQEKRSLVRLLCDAQNADGGWGMSSIGWSWRTMSRHNFITLYIRSDDSPFVRASDGYATGIVAFALMQAGVHQDDPHLRRGLSWLRANQNPATGSWPGYSMVDRRPRSSETGLFMTDAATAYAVLALAWAEGH